jgi:DNA-binding CsgD family transcriptional regulator
LPTTTLSTLPSWPARRVTVLKDIRGRDLVDAIRRVAAGEILLDVDVVERSRARLRRRAVEDARLASLGARERRILELLSEGLSNREIADVMFLAEKTIKNYVSNLLAKLGFQRRTEAALFAQKRLGRGSRTRAGDPGPRSLEVPETPLLLWTSCTSHWLPSPPCHSRGGSSRITTVFQLPLRTLTIGLGFMVAVLQTIAYRKKSNDFDRMARFFGKLFLINFAIGVVTGIVQEFQFGMDWSRYSVFVGNIFGPPLAIEALLAFFMESTFLGVWIFGRGRVSPKVHLASIWLASLGTLCRPSSSWPPTPGCSTPLATRSITRVTRP